MIGTIDIKVNAARPNMPLSPMFAFKGSPSSLRIMDVPKSIGTWTISSVKLVVKYPNNTTKSATAVRSGNVWVATIEGCDISGKVTKGYEIVASGKDENNEDVSGYVLGVGDVMVLERDAQVLKDIEKVYVKMTDELPTIAKKGDVCIVGGIIQLYNGTSWMKVATVDSVPTKVSQLENDSGYLTTHQDISGKVDKVEGKGLSTLDVTQSMLDAKANTSAIPTKTSQLTNDSGYITLDEVDANKITSEDGKQYINGEGEVWKNGPGFTNWVLQYVGGQSPMQNGNLIWVVNPNDDTKGWWRMTENGVQQTTNPEHIGENNKSATNLTFKQWDVDAWYDVVATRQAIASQWLKNDDLALKSQVDVATSTANQALSRANEVDSDIWGTDGINDKINDLYTGKATINEVQEIRTNVEGCQEQIAILYSDKITKPTTFSDGQILKVVEVEDTPTTRDGGASLMSVSPRATTHLEWQAVDPDAIPTKTSDLTNDSGFLTEHQSLVGYATETWVEGKGYLTEHQSLEDYATKSELPTKTSQLTNDSGFITAESGVAYAITASSADSVPWSGVQDKPTIPSKTSDLTNDSGFITSSDITTKIDNPTTKEDGQVLTYDADSQSWIAANGGGGGSSTTIRTWAN